MDDFNAIPVFVEVVKEQGFSSAARALGVSKSAVSKRIGLLEQHLGVKLFHRTTRKLSLTEAGEHYYEHALVANNAAQDASDAVAQLQGEPQGRLRINTPMSFGRLHVAPLIPEFLKRYPKISIEMVMDDKVVDLVRGGFDLAIRSGDLPDSSLIARKIAPLTSVLCASPDYIKDYGLPKHPNDLLSHNCLSFSYSRDVKEWVFVGDHETISVEVNGQYQVNNSEALREAILQNVGIGRLPTFVAGSDIKEGRLIQLMSDYRMPQKALYAVFLERQYMPAKVRAFLDFLIASFGENTPEWEL